MKKLIVGFAAVALLSCAQKKELATQEALKDIHDKPEVQTDLYSLKKFDPLWLLQLSETIKTNEA